MDSVAYSQLEPEPVREALSSEVLGLTSAEAQVRLQRDGLNALVPEREVAWWRRLFAQFQDPLVYLLVGAILVSIGAWAAEGRPGAPIDALVIGLVLVANALLGYAQEARAQGAVAALSRMTAVSATVFRDGAAQQLPASGLVVGDLLVLAEGDSVGADGRVVRSEGLKIAESSLTGESSASDKSTTALRGTKPLGDLSNMAFKGTAVVQGRGQVLVTGTGMNTEIGKIARLLHETEQEPTPLETEIARVGRVLGIAVVAIAVLTMTTLWLVSDVNTFSDAVTILLLGVSLAVAAVPEGLPAILSVVLSIGVRRLAGNDAIVKKLSSVETLGSASVICSDKTGTLTRNEMTMQRVMTASGVVDITGAGYSPHGELRSGGDALTDERLLAETIVVLCGGSLASNASVEQLESDWVAIGDPTEAAFLVAESKLGATQRRRARFTRVAEVPFTSERKLMSTLEVDHDHADARVLVTKGAPDVLLPLCSRVRVGMDTRSMTEAMRCQILRDVERMSEDALRTLAVAYRPLEAGQTRVLEDASETSSEVAAGLEDEMVYTGTVGIIDPARTEAAAAIADAHAAGIRVVMITGDHPATGLRIARDLGIASADDEALTGVDLEELDQDGLRDAVADVSVFARVAPVHKLRIVDALQATGNVVAMTGDGVNDAPALKAADIGVAMGISGTEVTKQAATMVLADDNFATIVVAVRQGRVIFDNIKKFLRYLLSSNAGEVLTVFGGVVLAGAIGLDDASNEAVVLPLLATQILWINLITDSAPALAMGVDPEIDSVMARGPRQITERVIDAQMWRGVFLVGLVIAASTLLTIDIFLPGGLVGGEDSLEVARTCGFTTLVLAQLFNAFNSRSETTSAFRGMFANHWLWAAVGFGVVAQVAVVELSWLQTAFGTASLDLNHWLVCTVMASSVLWFDEVRKFIARRWNRNHGPRAPAT